MTQAYEQSRDNLTRKIFILPKEEDLETLGIKDDELLEFLLPLYVICDAGDYWGVTAEHLVHSGLGMPLTTAILPSTSGNLMYRRKERLDYTLMTL